MNENFSQNWVKINLVPHLEGVKTLAANFTSERTAPRHVHQDYVFGLMVSGATEIDCGHCGATHVLRAGNLLLTEAHEVYSNRALGKPPWQYFSISVSKEKLVSLLDSLTDGKQIRLPHFTQGTVKNNRLRKLFLKLHSSLSDDKTALEQESLLLDWIAFLEENYTDAPSHFLTRRIYQESNAIRRVREFINENSAEEIKLQNLTEISGLSPFHLNRTFSAQVGLPPHEFQNQLRIEKAVKLLSRNIPLAEIAVEAGFADQSHFNRFFKRYTGVTPKNFLSR